MKPHWLWIPILAPAVGCDAGRGPVEVPAVLVEITAAVGLDEAPPPWPDGRYRIPEISVGGIGLFDCDGDGDLDLYQVRYPPPDRPEAPAPNSLWRWSDGAFVDASAGSGLDDPGYGSGVAVGDVDGDGDLDVFIANVGPDALYRNDGDGTFTDVTASAGVLDEGWSSCAAFVDYDRDGDLDLYVSRYLVDDPGRVCRPRTDEPREYCGPTRYQGVADSLYRNRGDGTFEDVSRPAGLAHARPGFGVICADFTGDGWVDIYVANDMKENQLYVNRGDGTFRDEAMERGVALNGAGKTEASMGVAAGDVDGDGTLDLFMTHLVDQTNTLYVAARGRGDGVLRGHFADRSASSGLGAPSLAFTGWGCGLVDLDHDGDLDVALVNGRVARGPVFPDAAESAFWNDYAEPNQLFLGRGDGAFDDASGAGAAFTRRVEVSRGLAFGDLDGDGDVDLVSSNLGEGLRVFRNDAPPAGHHWLRVRALTGRRDALGALVTVACGGRRQARPLISAYSFASASEPVAHFGLGACATVETIEVLWPDGAGEGFRVDGVDRTVTVRRGEGEPLGSAPR